MPHFNDRTYLGPALRWWQHLAARYVFNQFVELEPEGKGCKPYGCVLNLGIGTGKTRAVLEAIFLLGGRVRSALIVCPKAVMTLWRSEQKELFRSPSSEMCANNPAHSQVMQFLNTRVVVLPKGWSLDPMKIESYQREGLIVVMNHQQYNSIMQVDRSKSTASDQRLHEQGEQQSINSDFDGHTGVQVEQVENASWDTGELPDQAMVDQVRDEQQALLNDANALARFQQGQANLVLDPALRERDSNEDASRLHLLKLLPIGQPRTDAQYLALDRVMIPLQGLQWFTQIGNGRAMAALTAANNALDRFSRHLVEFGWNQNSMDVNEIQRLIIKN